MSAVAVAVRCDHQHCIARSRVTLRYGECSTSLRGADPVWEHTAALCNAHAAVVIDAMQHLCAAGTGFVQSQKGSVWQSLDQS